MDLKEKATLAASEALDNLHEPLFIVDPGLKLVYTNIKGAKALKREREDVYGRCFSGLFPEASGFPLIACIEKTLSEKIKLKESFRSSVFSKWVSVTIYPVSEGAAITFHDIHELQEAREQLQQKEAQWRALIDNTPDPIARFDKDLRLVFANAEFLKRKERPAEFYYGKTNLEMGFPEEIAVPWMQKLREVFDTGQPATYATYYTREDKKRLYMVSKIVPELSAAGKVNTVLAIGRDITEQKLIEEQLRKSEQIYNEAERLAHIGSWEKDLVTGELVWSDELYRIYGFERGAISADREFFLNNIIHPADREAFCSFIENVYSRHKPEKVVYRVIRPSGEMRVVEARARIIYKDGQPSVMRGTCQDITELEQVQQELKEKAHFIGQIADAAAYLIGITDLQENKLIYANNAITELFGDCSDRSAQADKEKWTEFIHPDDLQILKELFANTVTSDQPQEASLRVKRKDGAYRWLRCRAAVFKKDADGRPTQLLSIALDATDSKIAEDKLKENKLLLEAIFNSSTSGIEVYQSVRNANGEITDFECVLVNRATQKYLRRDDLIGKRLVEEYPGVKPAGLFDRYKRVVEQNEILDLEHSYERQGVVYWFQRVGVKMNDGLVVTWEDITSKKKIHANHTRLMLQKQKEQARAVFKAQEEERKRIAEALHNELGQLLYITKLQVADDRKDEADKLLDSAIEQVRTISFELMPTILRDFGLETAIKDLARKKLAASDIHYNLQLNGLKKRPSSPVEEAVFRMVQELLNNVVKHAKATLVNIEVAKAGKHINIKVEDNGLGFNRQVNTKTKSFGLESIKNRIKLLNGTIAIDSAPGAGTRIFITMPARASRTLWH